MSETLESMAIHHLMCPGNRTYVAGRTVRALTTEPSLHPNPGLQKSFPGLCQYFCKGVLGSERVFSLAPELLAEEVPRVSRTHRSESVSKQGSSWPASSDTAADRN